MVDLFVRNEHSVRDGVAICFPGRSMPVCMRVFLSPAGAGDETGSAPFSGLRTRLIQNGEMVRRARWKEWMRSLRSPSGRLG